MTTQTKKKHHIRWMIRRDIPEVLQIETLCDNLWVEEDFLFHLRQRNCIGMIVEEDFEIGYLKDLVFKKVFPIKGISKLRQDRNGRRISSKATDPVTSVMFSERTAQKISERNWGQPFEVYWNYNAIRRNKWYQKRYIEKFRRPVRMLPPDRAIVKQYIKFDKGGHSKEHTRRDGTILRFFIMGATPLNKFEVFKAASEAKYKKKHMR